MNNHHQARLRRARAFDRGALTAIYDDYHLPLYRYIYRQVSEVETARDLTAEVFKRFLQALQEGRGPESNEQAWLYRTAHNVVVDYYRRRQHRHHVPLEEPLPGPGHNDPALLAERGAAAGQVRQALARLTPDQRQVIILKFLEELSNDETAAILNKPVGAVKSLQHRALAALQRYFHGVPEKVP